MCYRIGDPDGVYPIFDATASRLYPGRWNTPASPMIYAGENSCLEVKCLQSIPRAEEPARNHLRLDFGRSLEDAQDAGVAEDAGYRKLQRKAVSPVDLHRIVGVGPGHSRSQQLGHPCL